MFFADSGQGGMVAIRRWKPVTLVAIIGDSIDRTLPPDCRCPLKMAIHITAGRESGLRSLFKGGCAIVEDGRTVIVGCLDWRIVDICRELDDAIAMGGGIPFTADMTFGADVRRCIRQHVGPVMPLETSSRHIAKRIVNGQIIRRGRVTMAAITTQLCIAGARHDHHCQHDQGQVLPYHFT